MDIPNFEEGKTPESRIKKVLFNEVNFILAIISIVGVVYAIFFGSSYKMQKQIDDLTNKVETTQIISAQLQTIKDNDLKELHLSETRIESEISELEKLVIRLQVTLDERLPAR